MKNSYKIRHKKEGWTGTLVIEGINPTSWASHYMGINILANIIQDPKDKDGKYHEDPEIEDLDELEFIK